MVVGNLISGFENERPSTPSGTGLFSVCRLRTSPTRPKWPIIVLAIVVEVAVVVVDNGNQILSLVANGEVEVRIVVTGHL